MKTKKEQKQQKFDIEVTKARPRKALVEFQQIKPTITKAQGPYGHIYISYPAGTVGEQMPCVFCPGAECESIKSIGSKFPTIRYKCPVNSDRFSNPPPGIPKNCPRLNK